MCSCLCVCLVTVCLFVCVFCVCVRVCVCVCVCVCEWGGGICREGSIGEIMHASLLIFIDPPPPTFREVPLVPAICLASSVGSD